MLRCVLNATLFLLTASCSLCGWAQTDQREGWRFAISGDSRNCGDIVMPAIAAGVQRDKAVFYWHLGDFRAIYDFDQDIQKRPSSAAAPLTISDYERIAWQDFIDNQVTSFAPVQVFLGIGNHETIPPKSRDEALIQFADWMNAPGIQAQRLKDNPSDHRIKAYYHWIHAGIDFINLDNASPDQFDAGQIKWLNSILQRDRSDHGIRGIVVGMHAALPDSLAAGHSMSDLPQEEQSGRQVYKDLLKFRGDSHKPVYVLASHSHFVMSDIFNTPYWGENGGVLPGWIIGTAGAFRYALPKNVAPPFAKTDVYGYLLGTVRDTGTVDFTFKEVREIDVPAETLKKFGAALVHECFEKNKDGK